MPNYVKNLLLFRGPPERVSELRARVRGAGPEDVIDFDKIIPMPPSLDIEDGSRTTLGMAAAGYMRGDVSADDFIKQVKEYLPHDSKAATADEILVDLAESDRCDIYLGNVALDNIKNYGCATWYDWRRENWGTKWNADDQNDHDPRDGEPPCIGFSTAWNAPHPVVRKLAEMFPDIEITHHWADEDRGYNCGSAVYGTDGECVEDIPDGGSDEAYSAYVACWGQPDDMRIDENGHWHFDDDEEDSEEAAASPQDKETA